MDGPNPQEAPKWIVTLPVATLQEADIGTRDRLFYELARDLSSSLELDIVLRKVMDRVISLMKASRGFIVLVDATGSLSVQMSGGEADPENTKHFLGSRTVIEQVVTSGLAVVSTDASTDDRFKRQQSVIIQNLRSIIAVPLVTKGSVIGAVYVDNPFRAAIFEEKDKEFLQAIADLAAIAIDNARQYERSEFLRQLFERYVNKQVTDYVLARSDRETIFLPGERRQVTMLNSDIAGFSTLSQSMEAEELVRFLNDYFSRMIEAVLEHGGNIDKFQGDGMLVVFGAPNPITDHAQRALAAARAMIKGIDGLNRELAAARKPQISVGIGLDTGEVVAGHVGSEKRLEFTLIGVPVNNSSYLSKVRPAKVLMSETTRDSLPSSVEVIDYEPLLLKGANQKQPIYQLRVTAES
ncbi:MAG: GAF domain-containing protein [Candidatus Dormibacteraeota bacterium]|nr:GAF domain-containing protein [Candidatus Dormibacteraeota bacterium]